MKRMLAALAVSAAAVLAVTLLTSSSDTPPESSAPAALQTATLGTVTKPIPPPKAKFVRTIFATSTLKESALMLDFCKGPIAVELSAGRPVLVAEHDYCGGLTW